MTIFNSYVSLPEGTIRGMILQLWPNEVTPVSSWSYSTIPNGSTIEIVHH